MNIKKLQAPAPAPYQAGARRVPNDPLAVAVLAAQSPDGMPTGCDRLLAKSRRLQRMAAKARKHRQSRRYEDEQ